MNAPTSIRHSRILGLAEHRPAGLMTNDDLPDTLDTSDEWIQQRTGIKSRRVAGPDETIVTMSSDAARKALLTPASTRPVGLVILATCSMPQPIPGGAAQIATAIGATSAGAFDLNAACAGFCAVSTASDAVRTGTVEYAVVIGAEKITHWLDWEDRSSAILFGDGAGAAVIGASSEPGISPVVFGSDGTAYGLIDMTPEPANRLRLDGPAVFRWATTSLAQVALSICEAAGVKPEELNAVVLHQANLRIINSIARQIGAVNAVIATDVVDAGNTSAASVPLALARLRREGAVSTGDLALTLSFGSGLTWAGSIVVVP